MSNRSLSGALPCFGDQHASQASGANVLHGLHVCRRRSGLGTELNDALVLAHCLHHPQPLDHVVSIRLLDINIFAGLTCHDRRYGVPMIWSPDHHHVNSIVVDQASEITVTFRPPSLDPFGVSHPGGESTFVNVRDPDNVDVVTRRKEPQQSAGPPGRAHHPDLDFVIG